MSNVSSALAIAAAGFALVPVMRSADAPALPFVQTIALADVEGRIDHMALDAAAGRLYVAALGNNTVEVVDLVAGRRIDTLKGFEEPQGIVAVPDLHRLVIASGGDGKCRIYDSSLKLVGQVDNLADADNVRYDAKAKQAVVGFGDGALAFIDPQAGVKVGEVRLDGHPESFQLEANGSRIFVNVPRAGHIAVVDRASQAVVAKWPLTDARSNFPMALDEASHRLFVGCRSPARLLVLDTDSGKTVASLDIVADTDDVFYDAAARRIYVSGGGGRVSIIRQADADHYSAIADVPTAPGARTSLLDAVAGRLYVAAPHRGAQPAHLEVLSVPRPLVLKQSISFPQLAGGFNHHSADGRLRRVFLCATTNKSVEVLDLATGQIVKCLPGEKPSATCYAPDLNVLCVSRGKTVQLYDAASFAELAAIAMPGSTDELRYDPRTRQLLAGSMTAPDEGIATIDVAGRKLLGVVKTPPPQGFCLEEDGNRVFVCTPKADQISIVDRQKTAALAPWKLTDPTGGNPVAYDAATHRLFVGCRKPAKLLVLDTISGRTVASVDTGTGTDDLSFDPANRRIYVACAQDVISVIQQDDADHYRNIADVPSVPGARNCVFVPESGELCVTAPQSKDQTQPARVLVYQARP
jgi:DNA-binding beta-propeller fold protein YncE